MTQDSTTHGSGHLGVVCICLQAGEKKTLPDLLWSIVEEGSKAQKSRDARMGMPVCKRLENTRGDVLEDPSDTPFTKMLRF